MHQVIARASRVDRLLESVQHEVRRHRARQTPTNDPTREHVDHEGHEEEAHPGRHVREVRDPELIRPVRREVALDQVGRTISAIVADGRLEALASPNAVAARCAHQTLDRTPGNLDALTPELLPGLVRAVDALALVVNATNFDGQVASVVVDERGHHFCDASTRIASHWEACWLWWSRTIRTARSRTSGDWICPREVFDAHTKS